MPLPSNLKVSAAYLQWLLTCNRAIMGHLYKFTSAAGETDYFTDMDLDIVYHHIIWKSSSLRFEGLQRKVGIGLSVDEQTMKIWANPTDKLFGGNFLSTMQSGVMDSGTIVRMRVIWPFVTGNVAFDVTKTPIAAWTLFSGYVAPIVKGGASHVELKVKSALTKLNVNMPRNYYQPGCLWTLFSPGCTLSKGAYAVAGTVDADPTIISVPVVGGLSPAVGPDNLPQYALGRLLFTSGVNDGLQVLIDNNDTAILYLAYAMANAPSPGDTFTYWPGCGKAENTCDKKFNNKDNYRGFDRVPPVMVSA